MGYTEPKYGKKHREFFDRGQQTEMIEASDDDNMWRVFPGPINIQKLGFLQFAAGNEAATEVTITLTKESSTLGTLSLGGTGATGAAGTISSKAITGGTVPYGSYIKAAITGTTATPFKGIIFFDWVVPFADEDAVDKWDGSS